MGRQLKKITKNVLSYCGLCRNFSRCEKLVGPGCKAWGGNLDPREINKEGKSNNSQ
jgi:hypothetical protein